MHTAFKLQALNAAEVKDFLANPGEDGLMQVRVKRLE